MNPHSYEREERPVPATARPRLRPVARRAADPARRADKRDQILQAATRIFARDGFFNAQVADVARDAGVAAGTVYLYFKGKDDLLVSLFERTMRGAIDEARAALEGVTDPVERLRRIAKQHLHRLGADRDLAVVFQVEFRQTTKFMARFSETRLREYLGLIRDAFVDGQHRGLFRADINPTLAAKVLFGALDEMATNWVLSTRHYALADESDAIVDLIVSGAHARGARHGHRE
jgi:TetR/AcrR family transcriptional regulator, fatty acid metabolism regulator protein